MAIIFVAYVAHGLLTGYYHQNANQNVGLYERL